MIDLRKGDGTGMKKVKDEKYRFALLDNNKVSKKKTKLKKI